MSAREPQQWIIVRNWRKFQYYRDRRPPWIMLYTDLQHDDNWLSLPGHCRAILVGLWLEYASSNARLRLDTRSISARLSLRVTSQQLERLRQAGFIEFAHAPRMHHAFNSRAREETYTKTETEALKPKDQKPANASLNVESEKLDFAAILEQAGRRLKDG